MKSLLVEIEITSAPTIKGLSRDITKKFVNLKLNAKEKLVDPLHEPTRTIVSGIEGRKKVEANIDYYEVLTSSIIRALKERDYKSRKTAKLIKDNINMIGLSVRIDPRYCKEC